MICNVNLIDLSLIITSFFLIQEELCTSKQSDFGKLRSKGISSRDRKKRGGTSREAPFGSSGSLFVDVDKQMLSCIDKKDGHLAACSNHNSSEDLPSLSTAKRFLFLSFLSMRFRCFFAQSCKIIFLFIIVTTKKENDN